jgi:ketosteroid isomerase-like protein
MDEQRASSVSVGELPGRDPAPARGLEGAGAVRDTAGAMSQEQIEALREGYDRMNQRDYDAVLARVHPDFVYENDPAGPLAVAFCGRAEVKRFWEDFFGTWKDFGMEPYEIREAAGGKFVVRAQLVAYLEGTAEPLRMDFTHLWTVRDGVPERCRVYFDHAEALEAAGLRERPAGWLSRAVLALTDRR